VIYNKESDYRNVDNNTKYCQKQQQSSTRLDESKSKSISQSSLSNFEFDGGQNEKNNSFEF